MPKIELCVIGLVDPNTEVVATPKTEVCVTAGAVPKTGVWVDVSGVTNGVWVLVGGVPNIEGLVALLLDANTEDGVDRFIGVLKEEGWLTAAGEPNIDVVVVGVGLLNTVDACVGEDPKTEEL